MRFDELNEKQITFLARSYLRRLAAEGAYAEVLDVDRDEPSASDLEDALSIVPADVLEREYGDVEFTEDDF